MCVSDPNPGISEFITRGTQAASKFESLVNQIQKNERDIDAKLQSMETANLFKFPAPDRADGLPGTCDPSSGRFHWGTARTHQTLNRLNRK